MSKREFFPFFVDIKDKKVLIVGAGKVALRKIEKLLPFGPAITVVAKDFCNEIKAIKEINCINKAFEEDDIKDAFFVIAATDDESLNTCIANICKEKNILINSVDDLKNCNFVFPALVKKDSLCIGITTGGKAPLISKYLRSFIENNLPDNIDNILNDMDKGRKEIFEKTENREERVKFLEKILKEKLEEKPLEKGKVYLVGAGCGQADLITVKGAKLLEKCEVLIYDDLIADELINIPCEACEKIAVGKRCAKISPSQDDIINLVVKKANEGKMVVRLKGGDPFVFGRGAEEAKALCEAGIDYEVVPGITSAIAIPELFGIPVTKRGISRSFHVVTAHTKEQQDAIDYKVYANIEGTIIFMMGLNRLEEITQKLILAGKDKETKIAVVSGGNSPKEICALGTLETIAQIVKEENVLPPAVIVVGDVLDDI